MQHSHQSSIVMTSMESSHSHRPILSIPPPVNGEMNETTSLSTNTTATPSSTSTPLGGGAFTPGPDWILLSQGAEARVWKVPPAAAAAVVRRFQPQQSPQSQPQWIICKERFVKSYRHVDLDTRLTRQRCRMEARLLQKCRDAKIRVPQVLQVESTLLFLEYLEGQTTVREYLEDKLLVHHLPVTKTTTTTTAGGETKKEPSPVPTTIVNANDDHGGTATTSNTTPTTYAETMAAAAVALDQLARDMGSTVARLHAAGMIHGDLTTSNMMLVPIRSSSGEDDDDTTKDDDTNNDNSSSRITLIDFGLAKNTTSAEERAVDLYVLERALQSTHPALPAAFWDTALQAYQATTTTHNNKSNISKNKSSQQDTLSRLEQVRQRGRKRECFG